MNSILKTFLTALLFASLFSIQLNAQDSSDEDTGYLGDHFSLEGALTLFENASSMEIFEKELNNEQNHVNNLDLNEDGKVDYIRVVDNMEKDVHAIVLQVPISENESQDIAVIEIEKTGKESATLQIIGDEDVFGTQKIVEPFDIKAEQEGNGPNVDFKMTRVVVNVWGWPSVRFVYGPRYRPYVSPWRWRTYPRYWNPWNRHSLKFHRTHRVFKPHFHVVKTHRVVRAHKIYTPKRRSCKVVRTRTTVVRNKNGKVVGAKSKTTKTVRGKNGKVVGKKKTTKVRKNNRKGKVVKKTGTRRAKKRGG